MLVGQQGGMHHPMATLYTRPCTTSQQHGGPFVAWNMSALVSVTPVSLQDKNSQHMFRSRNFEINPQARNSLKLMMTELRYKFHKTPRIVWNSPRVSSATLRRLTVGAVWVKEPRSCAVMSQSLRRHMSVLSHLLIIGIIKLQTSIFSNHSGVTTLFWMCLTDCSNSHTCFLHNLQSHRFACLMALCLYLQVEEQQW